MSEAEGPQTLEEAQATLDKHWPGQGFVAVEHTKPDGSLSYEVWSAQKWETFKKDMSRGNLYKVVKEKAEP